MPTFTRRQDAPVSLLSPPPSSSIVPPPTTGLSTSAIAGIAVGGAVVLFAGLSLLLVHLARRHDRRRADFACPDVSVECGTEAAAPTPRRLRKKSVTGDQVAAVTTVAVNNHSDDNVGREESESRRSSQHTTSPAKAYSRSGSVSIGGSTVTATTGTTARSSAGPGCRSGSADAATQRRKQRSPEKQKGYGVYEHRRTSSWIDEDALHGPTVVSAKNVKPKTAQKPGWLDGGLSRSLSRLSMMSNTTERMGSPTLPYTETGSGQQNVTPTGSPNKQLTTPVSSTQANKYPVVHLNQPQKQPVYISPRKQYAPIILPSPGNASASLVRSNSNGVQSPRRRNSVALNAAQQLAGGARLPGPITIPHTQVPKPPRFRQSATDTELTEILRMTAERLEDGSRSERRQTLMLPYSPRKPMYESSRVDHNRSYMHRNWSSDGGDVSPTKSHKSAPAALMAPDFERDRRQAQLTLPPIQTPRHSRQLSRLSQASQASTFSDSDSLIPSKRDSQVELPTALSSPSRVVKTSDAAPDGTTPRPQAAGQQQPRPFSYASSMSSALSTLYSMEESSVRSPPTTEPKSDDGAPPDGGGRGRGNTLSAFDMFNENAALDALEERGSPKFAFDDGERPQPLRIRRGTLGNPSLSEVASTIPRPFSQATKPAILPKSRLSFATSAADNQDPFTVATSETPEGPARLSKVFSPLPADPSKDDAGPNEAQDIESTATPTPSPTRSTRKRVVPPPLTLRAGVVSPIPSETDRASSPEMSEAGLSSVYDCYCYNDTSMDESTDDTMTTRVLPETPLQTSPARPAEDTPTPRQESRAGAQLPARYRSNSRRSSTVRFSDDVPGKGEREQPIIRVVGATPQMQARRSAPSDESFYSQDQDPALDGGDRVAPLPTPKAASLARRSGGGSGGGSVRMTSTVAELRRMNSQVSTVSEHSVANAAEVGSPTLPEMRGGGFSPGVRRSGGRNYLALGTSSPGRSARSSAGSVGDVAARGKALSPLRRGGAARPRRGTAMVQEFEARKRELDEAREVMRGYGNSHRSVGARQTVQILTHSSNIRREEAAAKRGSVQSLYDEKGFLKG
ncbi:hypothetical protein GGS23DRAFT_592546 [Durotheca rogersii]|uniref:uncharacterized protein n=1 Tax=Durotheca rogersii TaxID=419775 RepID=UPI00221FCB22|nr:uncharacterized protein GGS23DRAFT_592546 [Durotheca rogersii]KAI5867206.1 hypothetical protein GGS23DRAFT_592546 [Durotheca rogersii]